MKRAIIGISIIVAGFILIGIILYFLVGVDGIKKMMFFFNKKTETTSQEINQPVDNTADNTIQKSSSDNGNMKSIDAKEEIISPINETVESKQEVTKNDLQNMATIFAERYGSFSNQSDFSNVADLRIYMSKKMKKWADDYIVEQRNKGMSGGMYYGIITKSINAEIKELDEDLGQASIVVKTRRRESLSTENNTSNVFDQSITINLIKENGAWKVDSATWQPK